MAEEQPWASLVSDLDPSPSELTIGPHNQHERVAVIRTSDRITYKRCRRRWGWSSHLRHNLGPKTSAGPLWFGSGIHFAMEDFHGYNHYKHPATAFQAYVYATTVQRRQIALPADVDDLILLGTEMMKYYAEYWLLTRDPLQTFIYNNVPQVEVHVNIDLPLELFPIDIQRRYDRIVYSATFDRVIQDAHERLWIQEYKTAKVIQSLHYLTDPQIGAYCWLGNAMYDRPIAGVIYQQFLKDIPEPPRTLVSGRISTDKRQRTTHGLYRAALKNLYGADNVRWPIDNLNTLNELARKESSDSDIFVRRDRILRNEYHYEAEGEKIRMEVEEMLDPALALYPNPTRDCAYMCPFLASCVDMDDGSDYEHDLKLNFQQREAERDTWRQHLPHPSELPQHNKLEPANQLPQPMFL